MVPQRGILLHYRYHISPTDTGVTGGPSWTALQDVYRTTLGSAIYPMVYVYGALWSCAGGDLHRDTRPTL